MAPIIAFELNIVGLSTEFVYFSSGAGTIAYAASNVLTPLNSEPPCADPNTVTAETSNCLYGLLPAIPANTFTQTFAARILPPI